MPLATEYPLSASLAGVTQLQANGTIDTGNNLPQGIDGRLFITADPVGERGNVLQATLYESDALTASGRRSEIRAGNDQRQEYWYTWDCLFTETAWLTTDDFVVMQIHDNPDGGDPARAPNFLLAVEAGELRVMVPSATLPTEATTLRTVASFPVTLGEWMRLTLNINWQISGIGLRRFWANGVQILNQNQVATAYDDVSGPYLKLGPYNYFSLSSWTSRTLYLSNVRIWSGAANFVDGMGMSPVPPYRRVFAL